MEQQFKEGDRITWKHIQNAKRTPHTVYKHGEYGRLKKHKSDYCGPQMAVIILDDKFCYDFAPISELTKERA